MTTLADKTCVPCRGGVPPLTPDEIGTYTSFVPGWAVVDHHHLERAFIFDDFATALAFVNAVGAMAEEQGHHPDIVLSWGKVKVTIWTHKIDGLAEADFIFAAKVERIAADAPGLK